MDWFIPAVLASMVKFSFPLLVASLGEAVAERSGVYNLGMEGYMLFGAFFGFYGALVTHSIWAGILIGILAGMLLSLVHAYFSITLRVNQIISGIALWLVGIGVTSFMFRSIGSQNVGTFAELNIPVLSDIPYIGRIVFQQNILVYLGFLLALIFSLLLKRTPFGLLNRAVGDNPLAVDLAGHSVYRIRYISILICGAMSGLGGAYLSLAILGTFSENMTAGRGFMALCIVMFGKWDPMKIVLGVLLFAGAESLQVRLQAIGVPIAYPFLLMIPYVLTLIVLVTAMRKGIAPAKLGIPYAKGED